MGYVHRRLVSTVSTAHLKQFPPSSSLLAKKDFDPEAWADAQLPPPSALSAFAHRIGLSSVLETPELVQQACTHPSFIPLYQKYREAGTTTVKTNAQLAIIGNSLLGLFAAEHVHATYPHLPTRVSKAAVTAYVGPLTCAALAHEMGAAPLLRWQREPRRSANRPPLLHSDALASIPRALTALVYQKRSLPSARQFVQSYLLSRDIDLRGMIKFRDPKTALLEMVHKFQRPPPKSRLLKETGRYTNSPVFVVGIYSGEDKLGEGFGSSLKMAEFRAAEDALLRVYLTRTPSDQVRLPTATFPLGVGNVFRDLPARKYQPPPLVASEIMWESSGKGSSLAQPWGTVEEVP